MGLPLRARAYLGAMLLTAVGLTAYWLVAWPGSRLVSYALLALLTALAVCAIHFPLQLARQVKVEVTIAVYFAMLLLFGPAVALPLVACSHLLGGLTLGCRRNPLTGKSRRDLISTLFNTGQMVAGVGLGAVVYYALAPAVAPAALQDFANLWAVPAAATTMYLANTFAVATMVGLACGESPLAVWLSDWRTDILQFAGLFLLGLAAALTGTIYPWAPLVLALPATIIYVSLKRTVELSAQTVAAVEALADVVDMRDPSTYRHSAQVAAYAEALARRLDLPSDQVALIRLAARVHDLGKLGIPDAVLFKPARLEAAERALMERHSEMGAQVLARFPQYRAVRELVLAHHERFDGRGYPRGLRGERVPLGAYVIGAADAFEAMTADRPYRKGMSVEHALAELRRGAGSQFHPAVAAAFEGLIAEQQAARRQEAHGAVGLAPTA